MSKIINPHHTPKNKTQQRLDVIYQTLSKMQQGIIHNVQNTQISMDYNLFMIEKIVEYLSDAKIIDKSPTEFFKAHAEEYRDKINAQMEKDKNETNTNKEQQQKAD